MKIEETSALSHAQALAVLQLWNAEYPVTLQYNSDGFAEYLEGLMKQKHYLLSDENGICGWAFTFSRDSEVWFAIIIDGSIHGKGYGSLLLNKLKEKEPALNGWAIDHNTAKKAGGAAYLSPLRFYLKNNFTFTNTRLETEKLSAIKICWSALK